MERPRKRSNPVDLLKQKQAIVQDMEARLPPDSEDPESVQRRQKRLGIPPVVKGGLVTGFKKTNPPV